jgi:hypothetical protein
MTLILKTKSHGNIESGFFGPFTEFIRLGDYSFTTKDFCNLVKDIAENPDEKDGRIVGFDDPEEYFVKFRNNMNEFAQEVLDAQKYHPKSHKSQQAYIDRQTEINGGRNSSEDRLDLQNNGKLIPVKITDKDSIVIGVYEIPAPEFSYMAVYVANGGFLGWKNNKKPEFAKSAIEAIEKSRNSFYKTVQKKQSKK